MLEILGQELRHGIRGAAPSMRFRRVRFLPINAWPATQIKPLRQTLLALAKARHLTDSESGGTADAKRLPYDSNRALTVISALNSFDTGHPVSAFFTA